MNATKDEASHEKLIEDYLFSGYKPASYKCTFDVDQQFAKPIEDEDIFGISSDTKESKTMDGNFTDQVYDSFTEDSKLGCDSKSNSQFLDVYKNGLLAAEDCDELGALSNLSGCRQSGQIGQIDVDDLFDDDKSLSKFSDKCLSNKNDENKTPDLESIATKKLPQIEDISPIVRQAREMRKKIKEQILSLGLPKKKVQLECDKDGMIDLGPACDTGQTPPKSKRIFEMLQQKAEKLKNSPYGGRKLTWEIYKDVLRKRISAEKRKIWDSLQQPAGNFDEEEEIIGSPDSSSESCPCSPVKSTDGLDEEPEDVEDDASEGGLDAERGAEDVIEAGETEQVKISSMPAIDSDDDW